MIWDQARKDGPGAYGEGLAEPLGEMRWLADMRGPVTFRSLRMGEYGDLRFPYHLLKHEVGLAPDPVFRRLADLAKRHVGVPPNQPAQRPKVVLAQRRHTRVLMDSAELQQRLEAAGIEATIVEFATMTFAQQACRPFRCPLPPAVLVRRSMGDRV